ncbi:MAG: glycoside hydrolase N-terminal domain-containing protein [Bryobacteraceae bacterium]
MISQHRLLRGLLHLPFATAILAAPPAAAPHLLWYRQAAAKWEDALPLGNGRLGAMVFGGIQRERIQLNEDTIWNGRKRDRVNPEAAKALPEVRRLLFEGKPLEATELADEKLKFLERAGLCLRRCGRLRWRARRGPPLCRASAQRFESHRFAGRCEPDVRPLSRCRSGLPAGGAKGPQLPQ